jgi:hypothetical protein
MLTLEVSEVEGWPRSVRLMELYVNKDWTERCANSYIAEAAAWSENGNHATIYTMGISAQEADAKLEGALRELKLVPEPSLKNER